MSESKGLRSIKNLNDVVMKWLASDGPERKKLHTNGIDRKVVIAQMKLPTMLLDYIAFLVGVLNVIIESKPATGTAACENCIHMQQMAAQALAGKGPAVTKEKASTLNATMDVAEKKMPL